ncbi:MAG TPA: MerR family transcriptional regulator [Motiliproteus sp.]
MQTLLVDIDTLARELNLGKDRLRIWEKRYGFPKPLRREDGQRLYPPEQVQRLRQICHLLDGGARAGAVVPLSAAALTAQLQAHQQTEGQALPHLRGEERLQALLAQLDQLPSPDSCPSLQAWIEGHVEPLIAIVGQAWAAGQLPIWGEHLLTETLQRQLGQLLCRQPRNTTGPRVLLCTPPGEQHRLGMLLAELVLNEAGATTLCLGSNVPLDEICAAAQGLDVDVIALSCSVRQKRATVMTLLEELKQKLPHHPIWLGGSGASHLRRLPQGVIAIRQLSDTRRLLKAMPLQVPHANRCAN